MKLRQEKDSEEEEDEIMQESEESLARKRKLEKKKENRKQKKAIKKQSRVVFVGHLPYGFFETQLLKFFEQFGSVSRVRVSRNPKTGNFRHYAFLEFEDPEVAEIAATSMDGYVLYNRRLVCHIVELSKIHKNMFRAPPKVPTLARKRRAFASAMQSRLGHLSVAASAGRYKTGVLKDLVKREDLKRRNIEKAGIEYDFPGFKSILAQKKTPSHVLFKDD